MSQEPNENSETPAEQSLETPAKPSEAEHARRRGLLIGIGLLILAIVVLGIARFDDIARVFKGEPDASASDALREIRTQAGEILSPVSIVLEDADFTTELKALPRRWAIANHDNARVQPGMVAMLKTALEKSALLLDASKAIEPSRQADLPDALSVTLKFENQQTFVIKVRGEEVLFVGADRTVTLPGLMVSANPDHWRITRYDLLKDFDYESIESFKGEKITPETLGGMQVQHPDGEWDAALVVKRGTWAVTGKGTRVNGKTNVLNGVVYAAQNININGLWTAPKPELYELAMINRVARPSLRVSIPKGNADACLRLDSGGALYRISAVTARMLLPSFKEVDDSPVAPPPEDVEGPEIVGIGAGFEIILIAHQGSLGDWKMSDPLAMGRTSSDAHEIAQNILEKLQAAENKGRDFAVAAREYTSWRDGDRAMTKIELFPANAQEFKTVIDAGMKLEDGQIADKVFSTEFGEVILWRRKDN